MYNLVDPLIDSAVSSLSTKIVEIWKDRNSNSDALLLQDRSSQTYRGEGLEEEHIGYRPPDRPAGIELNMFDTQTHVYSENKGVNANIFAKIFGLGGESIEVGIVRETKKYGVVPESILNEGAGKRRIEFGCSVRLLVMSTSKNAGVDVTIPNLAAQAQLGQIEARMGFSVAGFRGSLGGRVPSITFLNVEKYDEYMDSLESLEKYIFSDEGMRYISPTIIGYQD